MVVVTSKPIQPLASALPSLSNKHHFRQASRFTLPMTLQSIADLQKKDVNHPNYTTWTEPQNFFTWTYRTAQYTDQGLSRMHRLDSTIRKVQRPTPNANPLIGLTLSLFLSARKIVARNSVTAPDVMHFPVRHAAGVSLNADRG
ncbi:hypothetical protein COCMIDRAFT_25236 [Bipolaris oryzae ATCC 44560]|uniref:Uncharacterized protein n=1 Tax=Bipolaris oryzae ATCC 44560 TaxID=930090 RepID=W6ZAE0_COCMI|nr:uncharacterized protein COCMIDRAFT_25236 [Bipolaris oryzae ATCC 44560]EUC46758.1 hypothetical protein COCMIDRAFT_25236 [Bipolaris oryzae ATCC 44560]